MSNSEKGNNMTEASVPYILIYTTPTCPDCHALKRWFSQQGLAYEERDLTDPRIAEEANDTIYGLAASIFSKNIDRALRTSQRLRAGTTWVSV